MSAIAKIPAHVLPESVYLFDLYNLNDDNRLVPDPQGGLTFLHREAPGIFYTPANGGHWITTRYELMRRVLTETDNFSTAVLQVPKPEHDFKQIPLSLDPPFNVPYRTMLNRYFSAKAIGVLNDNVRGWAGRIVSSVAANGACEFIRDVAAPFPVSVFMEMMGLPLEKLDFFRTLVVEFFSIATGERQNELRLLVLEELHEVMDARRKEPRADLISRLLCEEIDGRILTQSELDSICFLLFLAGLDTVANGATFMMARLAQRPDLQAELVADLGRIPAFVDETLRMSGVVNTGRVAINDVNLGGAKIRKGDIILNILSLAGYDDILNPHPMNFDMDRSEAKHLMFGTGPHLCIGHILARLELRVLLEEWLKRCSSFQLNPSSSPKIRIGAIMALVRLDLVWPAP